MKWDFRRQFRFVLRDLDVWAYQRGVTLDFSRRQGKPTIMRSTLADAEEEVESWRRYYNRASEHPSGYVVEEKRLC